MGRRIGTLGLVNYRDHPTNKRYKIFSFYKIEEADYFEELLKNEGVWFERDEENVKEEVLHLFGVNENDFRKARHANYMTNAKFRKKIIKYPILRYGLLIIVGGAVLLGIIGYVKNMNKLDEKNKEIEQIDVNS